MDPDPHSINADPHHWLQTRWGFSLPRFSIISTGEQSFGEMAILSVLAAMSAWSIIMIFFFNVKPKSLFFNILSKNSFRKEFQSHFLPYFDPYVKFSLFFFLIVGGTRVSQQSKIVFYDI